MEQMWQGNVDMEKGHKWNRCITCRACIRAEWQSITCCCGQINKYGGISAARVGNIYKYNSGVEFLLATLEIVKPFRFDVLTF